MKNLFLPFTLLFVCFLGFSKTNIEPVLTKVTFANITVENLDTHEYKFRKDNCDGGFSYFSPFFTNPELINSTLSTTTTKDNKILVSVEGEGIKSVFKLYNFRISDDGNYVEAIFEKDEIVTITKFYGKNLNVDYVKGLFSDIKNKRIIGTEDCPACLLMAVKAAARLCKSAQNACSPCSGTLSVSVCGCSCTPANGSN